MPSRNQLKTAETSGQLFHVYSRGIARRAIFGNAVDRREFLQCLRRYLSDGIERDRTGRAYRKLNGEAAVLAYCLMPNHFHLIVYQRNPYGMAKLMRPALTGYVMAYNSRHNRTGRLFESVYKASPIADTEYAKSAIAYVHSNHETGPQYELCSHAIYTGESPTDWVDVRAGLAIFGGRESYRRFVEGYLRRRAAQG